MSDPRPIEKIALYGAPDRITDALQEALLERGLQVLVIVDDPTDIAALADAGLTAIHAVKKAIPILGAGTRTVVIGAGGLGHIGIQCLKAYTPTEIIVVDPSEKALALAREVERPCAGARADVQHGREAGEVDGGRNGGRASEDPFHHGVLAFQPVWRSWGRERPHR